MAAGHRVTIVGGGYSGSAAAVQLVRASATPLQVAVVEPREELGYGMAYSSEDPDHRLNGLPDNHMVDPLDPAALQRWYEDSGAAAADPGARAPDGGLFIRRRDFGRFVCASVRAHPSIRHERTLAIGALAHPHGLAVRTANGKSIESDLVVVATGHALARPPPPLAALAGHAGVIEDPAVLARVRAIAPDARVLVIGSGLTALDILSTLVRSGRSGRITVVSRHGLSPRSQRPRPAPDPDAPTLLERINGPVAPFLIEAGNPPSVRGLLRALRARVAEVRSRGQTWHAAFDDLRDVLWKIWPNVEPTEKRRFQRLLRAWYDAHRFRSPPQNEAMVRSAEERGLVEYRAARIASAQAVQGKAALQVELIARTTLRRHTEAFDAIVNCTGSDAGSGVRENPFLASLVASGLARPDPAGMGIAVDRHYRAIRADGTVNDRVRVIGPPSAGTFGDPFGAIFIASHVRRMLPEALATLHASPCDLEA